MNLKSILSKSSIRLYSVVLLIGLLQHPLQASEPVSDDELSLVEHFSASDVNQLPVGIKKDIGGASYTVAFTNAHFENGKTFLAATLEIVFPANANEQEKVIQFAADDLEYTQTGGILSGKLKLVSDVKFDLGKGKLGIRLIGGAEKDGKFESCTYAEITCDGFKELNVVGDVTLSRTIALPVNDSGEEISNGEVNIPFAVKGAKSWGDIVLDIDVPRFTSAKSPGFVFAVHHAVLDLSETNNSPSFSPPANYQSYLPTGNLWKGLYISDLSILFPPEFKSKNSDKPLELSANSLLFDENGLTVDLGVTAPILTLQNGDASGWAFSIDEFHLQILANALNGIGFGGELQLPVSDKSTLKYNALLSNNEWQFTAKNTDAIDFNLWKAKCRLAENSAVIFRVVNHRFSPEAILNGTLTLNNDLVKMDTIRFEGLHLQTEQPYLSIKSMGYKGDIRLANFPLTVSDLKVKAENDEARLMCGIKLNLDGDSTSHFSSSGGFVIVGKLDRQQQHKWMFKSLDISDLTAKADFGKVKAEGTLTILKDDPTYGDGFAGSMNLEVVNTIKIDAKAIFGRKEFRYWAVDGNASGLSVIVFPGFCVTGFGGGLSYHMMRTTSPNARFSSGIGYEPDKSVGLGLLASINYAVPQKVTVTGDAGFTILFNSGGGINRMGIFGTMQMCKSVTIKDPVAGLAKNLNGMVTKLNANYSEKMTKLRSSDWLECRTAAFPDSYSETNDAKISGDMGIDYDFEHSTLHGSINVYVDAGKILHGVGANNRAGGAVIHFSPGKWYVHLGTPANRLGLESNIAGITLRNDGYFMIGDEIPAFPSPPQEVISILNAKGQLYKPNVNSGDLCTGRGIAFGAGFKMDTGDITFLILYARFAMGAGFDVMLKNYGSSAHCAGSGDPVGINGWYAQGQAYAYLSGKLGIRIKAFGIRKKFVIVEGQTAALLQAGLPNPTWFDGYLAGNFRLLGGAIKGAYKFKLSVGEPCTIEGQQNPIEAMQVIADVSPKAGSGKIDVFTTPQVVFNVKMGSEITLPDDAAKKTYRFALIRLELKKGSESISGSEKWNPNMDVVSFDSGEILPGESDLEFLVEIKCQEKISGNWADYMEDGKLVTEIKSVRFTTDRAPDYIPLSNIDYMYPIVGQGKMYVGESSQGYVKLIKRQPNILPAPQGWSQAIYFTSKSSQTNSAALAYDSGRNLLNFNLPVLVTAGKYAVKICSIPPASKVDQNVSATEVTNSAGDGNELTYTTRQASGNAISGETIELLKFDFSTSAYQTFAEKMQKTRVVRVNAFSLGATGDNTCGFNANLTSQEKFDEFELAGYALSGGRNSLPLVSCKVIPDDSYYTHDIKPWIYDLLPISGKVGLSRTINIPPTDGIELSALYLSQAQTDPFSKTDLFPYLYVNPAKYYADYREVQQKVLAMNLSSKVLDYVFKSSLKTSNYKINLQYNLPNGTKGSSCNFIYPYK